MANKEKHCAFCKAILFDDDDVVYCPECGAPHHRECYNSLGHCARIELHGVADPYEDPSPDSDNASESSSADNGANRGDRADGDDGSDYGNNDSDGAGYDNNSAYGAPPFGSYQQNAPASKRCPNGGRECAPDLQFCPYCGTSFGDNPQGQPQPNVNMFGAAVDPYGGVDPNDTIEDVKVSDVAAFVCVNTPRYIPKFKSISVRRSKSGWNWSGFIFSYLWLFFRKCWVEGIVALVSSFVSFFMTAPLMIAYSSAVQPYLSTAGSFNSGEVTAAMMKALSSAGTGMWALFIAGALLSLLTHLFVGLRGDIIYMRHALTKIKKISADSLLDDRQAMIVKAGGVNIFVVLIVFYGAKLIQNLVLQMLMAL